MGPTREVVLVAKRTVRALAVGRWRNSGCSGSGLECGSESIRDSTGQQWVRQKKSRNLNRPLNQRKWISCAYVPGTSEGFDFPTQMPWSKPDHNNLTSGRRCHHQAVNTMLRCYLMLRPHCGNVYIYPMREGAAMRKGSIMPTKMSDVTLGTIHQ